MMCSRPSMMTMGAAMSVAEQIEPEFENENLAAALEYAARGWHVLPCRPADKKPLTKHGKDDATTDGDTILAWWSRWPRPYVRVALRSGPSHGMQETRIEPASRQRASCMGDGPDA